MRRLFKTALWALFLPILGAYGQQDPNFAFYRYNMNLINPAFAGANGTELGMGIRSQWSNVVGAPETQGLFFSQDVGKRVGLGLSVVNDRTFIERQTSVAIDFSYKVPLDESTAVYLGLKGGVNSYDVNTSGLESVQTDPSINDIDGGFHPNIGLGALLKGSRYFVSLSSPRILSNERLESRDGTVSLGEDRLHGYLAGGYDFVLSPRLTLKPTAIFRYVDGAPLSSELTGILDINKRVELGLGYRVNESIGGMFIFNAGPKVSMGYAYESATEAQVQQLSNGSHEVFMRLRL